MFSTAFLMYFITKKKKKKNCFDMWPNIAHFPLIYQTLEKKKPKRKMNTKWTYSEIIKSDLFTCLVLVFLYSATTFLKILAKSLYSIFVFLFNEWGKYLKLAGHGEPWLSCLRKAAPRICVRRDARRSGRDSRFLCKSDFYCCHSLGRGCVWF